MKEQLQQRVLSQYQDVYPAQTLKQIAKTTSINLSRVFRLFNGYEMKISELEKFEKAIHQKKAGSLKYSTFSNLADKCYESLDTNQLELLIEEMQSTLYCYGNSQKAHKNIRRKI